ncbi:hypothetical protein [Ruminococcus flavefaciens]|uniref:hypothetical protein n=1 Tax=Ruminococcus flavefaciens TaxID=1265 RepID=UPI0026EA1C36|nr:hypothetical protein [Ruminococcus flavefaciens]
MRLIDADELTEMVWRERLDTRERIANLVARQPTIKAPTADVQSVKCGKWILFDKDCCGRAFYCSNCRKVTTTDDFENTPLEREEYFCPRCGADMRGENND